MRSRAVSSEHGPLRDIHIQRIDCPKGIAIRWYHIESGTPGPNEVAPSWDAAKQLVEDWVSGL
jgi:hypothetical protein